MEIFEYENRKKYEIQKELEDQLKSEKSKNYELLKKENLKSSTIPSMCYILRGKICVTCPFCKQQGRKTLKNLNKHYEKVHGNIPAAEREMKKKENLKKLST